MDSPGQQLFKAQQELKAIVRVTLAHEACTIERRQDLLSLTVSQQLVFLMGGIEFTPVGILLVQQLGLWLKTTSFREIRVMGPVDWDTIFISSHGHFAKRMALPQALTTALARRLQENGVDVKQLSAEWYGQVLPVATLGLGVNHQNNNRLEILLER